MQELRESSEHANEDPEPIDIATPVPLEFEMESDYGNIISKTELPIYSKDTGKIIYTITNNNVRKGFYTFPSRV